MQLLIFLKKLFIITLLFSVGTTFCPRRVESSLARPPHSHNKMLLNAFYGAQLINAVWILGALANSHHRCSFLFPRWLIFTGSLCTCIDSIIHLIHTNYAYSPHYL